MADLAHLVTTTLYRLDARAGLDIVLVAGIMYLVLTALRGTTGMSLLRGVGVLLLAAFVLGNVLQLTMVNWLVRQSLTALLIAIPILFQPELRRALERLGRTGFHASVAAPALDQLVETLAEGCRRLAGRHVGALIVLERETGLQDYVDTGTPVDGIVSVELLLTIFTPGGPIHDGAVIVRGGRIAAASCVLPLSETVVADTHLGTRHRAAIGITERTDAVALIVSEETGTISLAHNGTIARSLDKVELRRRLASLAVSSAVPRLGGLLADSRRVRSTTPAEARSEQVS